MVIAGVFAVFQFKADSIDSISQRFELIEDDGGSGRDMIYEDVINRYQNSDLIYQIFGRGFDTVKVRIQRWLLVPIMISLRYYTILAQLVLSSIC